MGATLDAATLRRSMSLYLEALEEHREEIDSLNVFPVPDGDTGTNMLLTQRAVVEACESAPADLPGLGETIVRAALMGARGNSGVILSQILRGLCHRLSAGPEPRGEDLAEALALADEEARAAVAEPQEGTILSVLHDAARAAGDRRRDELPAVADAAFRGAEASLARTPEQLQALRDAGVVDAGGKGLVLLLDALRAAAAGEGMVTAVGPLGPVGHRSEAAPVESDYGHEVMYLIDCADGEVPGLRSALAGLGDSVVVVGGGGTYNAHVHTDEPDAAVAAGRRVGTPREVRVTSLDEQVAEHCLAGQARAVPAAPAPAETPALGSLVAVAEGKGLVRLFESLGAAVVEGGPGSNPSVRDVLEAVERAPGDLVVLLPNHRNIWPAADAAAEESATRVEVIRTRSVPQGLAAALELSPDGPPDPKAMRAAAERAGCGIIARAERAAETPAGPVTPGTWVGIDTADGEIRAAGAEVAEVAAALAGRLAADHHELATVFVGEEADDGEAERVAEAVRTSAGLEVEIQRGDQPRYPYLIGFE